LDDRHRPVHRSEGDFTPFGYNMLDRVVRVKDFELYSSDGLRLHMMGPLRSTFYRVGLVLRGSCKIRLGLEEFTQTAGTVNCTFPNQLFSKWDISKNIFGYYILFNPGFLDGLLPDAQIPKEFPFFGYSGNSFFQLEPPAIRQLEALLFRMNDELQEQRIGREKAIQLYLYLLLLELKRNYRDETAAVPETTALVIKFKKLVNEHYLSRQRVADYAEMLYVTPNHLNRTVKEVSGRTASDHITEMILQEAKVLLKYTDLSVAEISYKLQFSEPSSFNRSFKKGTGLTPLEYRNAGSGQ
jgi:AraC family transcriptional regulator, transcriptional activator of pobA